MFNPYNIVYTVLITEKATTLADKRNGMPSESTQMPIKSKSQGRGSHFEGVKVSDVNVMNYRGKVKRMRTSRAGKRADWKKAMVTLSEGSIDLL